LESINDHLTEQTSDFARFSHVLSSKKHFDLVSEKEIQVAKAHLSAEIAPQLKQLIMKAEEALQREERRSKSMKVKVSRSKRNLKVHPSL
jgi:DASH complex subunit SPC19